MFRSGFITLVGRPNVGKSTLLNRLVGRKVAIVSPRPQTTRHTIRGVRTTAHSQMIFLDTPGVHRPRNRLGVHLFQRLERSLHQADVLLLLLSADGNLGPGDRFLFHRLRQQRAHVLVVINKIDRVHPTQLLPLMDAVQKQIDVKAVVPISALHGEAMDILCGQIEALLPTGPIYYEKGQWTDQSDQQLLAELIREQVLLHTAQEVPHSVAVQVDSLVKRMSSKGQRMLWSIRATVYVERDSQKGIIIGKNGDMVRKLGELARLEMERLFSCRIYLELWVKVKRDWRQESGALRQLGLDGGKGGG